MSARKSSSAKRSLVLGASLLPTLMLGACADYAKQRDTITTSAGDAIAHNKVVHIIDPWPRVASNTRILGNGQRVDRVTKQYLTGDGASTPAGPTLAAPMMQNLQPSQPTQ